MQIHHAPPHFVLLRYSAEKSVDHKKARAYYALTFEPKAGLEPATYALRMRCSTN